jgi:hypothetical protein
VASAAGTSLEQVAAVLRPARERLELVAAGGIPLAIALVMINVRFDGVWGRGVLLVVTLLACAAVFGPALTAEREGEHPHPVHTALLVAGLTLLGAVIFRLAQVFGVDRPLDASGTLFWTSALFAGIAAVPAWGRLNSPVCALIEVLAGGLALEAFVDWVFDPDTLTTARWILLLLIFVYAGSHLRARDDRPRHAVQMVNAAGVAALVLILSFLGAFLPLASTGRSSTWWELVVLVAGLGLVAYAVAERERGPGYLGFAVLIAFAGVAGVRSPGGASLVGWPLLLLLVGGAVLVLALRPAGGRRPGPPDASTVPTVPVSGAPDAPTEPQPPARP